jgi:soluble lytic murein transglycosylase
LSSTGGDSEALGLYRQYLAQTSDHGLDGYAWLALARDLDARDDSGAVDDYRRAVSAGLPAPQELDAATKVAAALIRAGNVGDAVDWYVGQADRYHADDPIRAEYLARAADTAARNGEPDRASALVGELTSVGSAPGSALDELLSLRSLGVSVDDLAAGESFLKSGDYAAAVSAFGDYIDRFPNGAQVATARFERGEALLGEHADSDAIAQFQKFIAAHPSDPRVSAAKTLLAQAQAGGGSSDPGTAPPSDGGAAFAQGWAAYEALDFGTARSVWAGARQQAPSLPGNSPALLWLAKLELKGGDTAGALRDLRLSWDANPGGYYAFRARELAASLGENLGDAVGSTSDPARERADFQTWLAGWTHAPADATRHPYLGAAIAQTDTLDRIRALMDLGLRDQVNGEYQAATDLYWSDGRSLYALADTLSQVGLDAQSMKVAYRLLMISPAPNAYQSPVFLQRLVYPFPYRDLVETDARRYGVDPLLLVALMRQESSFDPRASSPAGARGLTQFMPSTAQTLAAGVGLGGFSPDDLNNPAVAIKLGAAYLAGLSREFNGNPYLAIAAYNAGSGNVHAWLGDNPRGDFDLLAEEIPFQETRDYVRNVYRFYQQYLLLYAAPPSQR